MMLSPKLLDTTVRYQLVAVALATVAATFVWPDGALGVLSGGLLMAGNFWLLKSLSTRAFVGPADKAKGVYALLLGFKIMAVFGAIFILVTLMDVNPVGIAAGMGTLFVGLAFGILHHLNRPQPQVGK